MRTIAIGLLALVLAHGGAGAQTADEKARILRDFEQRVAAYTPQRKPRIFTLPVAVVFRQEIARALAARDGAGAAVVNGVGAFPHPAVMAPFPSDALHDFPRLLEEALPPLPTPLEYRLIGHALVVRDRDTNIIVDVLRDAVGSPLIVIR